MPAVLVARPQKAEALVSLAQCFAAKAAATAKVTAEVATMLLLDVNTIDAVVAFETGTANAGTEFKSCFLRTLTKIIAKTMLHTFTQSIVKWINTGFQGSPSFVTNPEGFLSDIADQTIGRVIEDISPLLCSPFRLDIRFALGLNLSLNTKEEVHCKLSDVIANVRGAYDGFVAGAAGSGNLSNWIHIAGTQQNNPYGAYIATTNRVSASITTATGQQIKLLDWGKGFKSWRSCKRWGPDVKDANHKVIRKGPCIEEGPIKTPGSIIQEQTTGALGTTFRELELADEIDEIVGALINQLLVKAITGAGGLLGASKGDITSGGQSAADALLTDPYKAVAGADAKTPEGINCRLRYYPSTVSVVEDGRTVYLPDNSVNGTQVWTDNLNRNTQRDQPYIIAPGASRNPSVHPTWEAYFAAVSAGCANEWNTLIDSTSKGSIGSYSGGAITTPDAKSPSTPQVQRGNIAQGKLVTQSSVYGKDWRKYGPQNLTNGDTLGDSTYGTAFTAEDYNQKWFVIDLETPGRTNLAAGAEEAKLTGTEISEMKFYGPTDSWAYAENGAYHPSRPFTVYITTEDPTVFDVRNLANPLYKGYVYLEQKPSNNSVIHEVTYDPVQKKVTADKIVPSIKPPGAPVKGRYITILSPLVENFGRQAYFRYFGLTEVEVIGKQTRLDSAGNATAPTAPLSVAFQPAVKTLRGFLGGESLALPFGENIQLTTNKELTGVTLRVMLKAGNLLTSLLPVAWKQYFTVSPFTGTGVVFSYSGANKIGSTPPFILGDPSDRRINPIICTGSAETLLQGKCHKDVFDVWTQDTSDSWITFARDLSATPSRPITIGVVDALFARSGFAAPAVVQMNFEASYKDGAAEKKAQFDLNFTINN